MDSELDSAFLGQNLQDNSPVSSICESVKKDLADWLPDSTNYY